MTNTTQIKEWSQESSASLSRVLQGNTGPHVHPQPQGLSSLLFSGLLKSSCLTYVVARQPQFVAVISKGCMTNTWVGGAHHKYKA